MSSFVFINARGTLIQAPINIRQKSKAIDKWISLFGNVEFYTNIHPVDVHELLDYLYRKGSIDQEPIGEMIKEFEINFDDDQINDIYTEIKSTEKKYTTRVIYNVDLTKMTNHQLDILIKKFFDEHTYFHDKCNISHNGNIYFNIDDQKKKIYLKEKELEENKKILNVQLKKYYENIDYVFDIADERTILTTKYKTSYVRMMTNDNDYFARLSYDSDEPYTWNLKHDDYKWLHIFLFKIEYEPYISHCSKKINEFSLCLNHDYKSCKKCLYGGFDNICCLCCSKYLGLKTKHLHLNDEIKTQLVKSYFKTNEQFVAVYLTYQSAINCMSIKHFNIMSPNMLEINFIESDKLNKYYWNNIQEKYTY